MPSRNLIDWIKSEEAKGFNDVKLKNILKKKGWPEKEIDLAINLAHKKKVNWMPLIISFALVFVFSLIFGSITPFVITFIVTILSLLYALMPYYNSKKQENYIELFIMVFTSGLFSLLVSAFFFNLLVLIVYLTGTSVTIYLIAMIFALSIIFLFYLFYLTISKLSKHFMGYFDHESFFVFKHWPFKILNTDWNKKWQLLKYPLIFILIVLVIFGFIFNSFIAKTNESIEQTSLNVKEQLKQQMYEDCLNKTIFAPNNSPYQQLLGCSSPFNQEQLKLKIIQEVEESRQKFYLEIFEKEFLQATWSNFNEPITEVTLYYAQLGPSLSFQRTNWGATNYEWNFTRNKKLDLVEHTNRLNENIKVLYPKFLAIGQTKIAFGPAVMESYQEPSKYSYIYLISFEKSFYNYLISKLLYFEKSEKELGKLRENYFKEKLQELYQNKNTEESLESKVIRLKIIETLLAKQIVNNDPNQKLETIEITQSPELLK